VARQLVTAGWKTPRQGKELQEILTFLLRNVQKLGEGTSLRSTVVSFAETSLGGPGGFTLTSNPLPEHTKKAGRQKERRTQSSREPVSAPTRKCTVCHSAHDARRCQALNALGARVAGKSLDNLVSICTELMEVPEITPSLLTSGHKPGGQVCVVERLGKIRRDIYAWVKRVKIDMGADAAAARQSAATADPAVVDWEVHWLHTRPNARCNKHPTHTLTHTQTRTHSTHKHSN
jgi:hypothetical protein